MNEPQTGAEGTGVSPQPADQGVVPPHGLEEILGLFGDIYQYIRGDGSLDPRWQADFLVRVELPFPIRLSWDHNTSVSQLTCHKLLPGIFKSAFMRIQEKGLQEKILTFGGCFAFRPQRTGSKLSTHAWGIAIDLNPESNAQGAAGDMDAEVAEIFRSAGFTWGGDWKSQSRDAMHFQYCSGY